MVQAVSPAACMAAGPGCDSMRALKRSLSRIQRIRPMASDRSLAGLTGSHSLPDPADRLEDAGSMGDTTT
ncbi:hypothetical protein D9M68_965180 [compost metagenome]